MRGWLGREKPTHLTDLKACEFSSRDLLCLASQFVNLCIMWLVSVWTGTWIDLQVEPRFGVDEKLVGGGEIPGEWNLKITREAQMGSPTTSYHVAIQGESELRVQATKRTSQNNSE